MSRIAQFSHLMMNLRNAEAVKDEKLENQLLDEMDYIWHSATECEREQIRALYTDKL